MGRHSSWTNESPDFWALKPWFIRIAMHCGFEWEGLLPPMHCSCVLGCKTFGNCNGLNQSGFWAIVHCWMNEIEPENLIHMLLLTKCTLIAWTQLSVTPRVQIWIWKRCCIFRKTLPHIDWSFSKWCHISAYRFIALQTVSYCRILVDHIANDGTHTGERYFKGHPAKA